MTLLSNNISIKKLDINIDQLKKMDCKYIFSAVEIKKISNEIRFLKKFEDIESIYKIYLYEII